MDFVRTLGCDEQEEAELAAFAGDPDRVLGGEGGDGVIGRRRTDIVCFVDDPYVLPAAGLPWFMTLFGRGTLITSLQTLWVGPELARGALHLLGELQGQRIDEFRDEEPGKILHEIRQGELTVLGEKPPSPY